MNMFTSLDLLVIVFMIIVAVGLLALSLMFLARRSVIKRVCFYIVTVLALYMAYVGIRIGLGMFPVQAAVGAFAGVASIAAVVLECKNRDPEKKSKAAYLIAAAALVIGVINAFM